MTENILRETAKIYPFPIRDRATKVGHRESQKKVSDLASAGLPYAECGSGWYHEAAVQEAEHPGKR